MKCLPVKRTCVEKFHKSLLRYIKKSDNINITSTLQVLPYENRVGLHTSAGRKVNNMHFSTFPHLFFLFLFLFYFWELAWDKWKLGKTTGQLNTSRAKRAAGKRECASWMANIHYWLHLLPFFPFSTPMAPDSHPNAGLKGVMSLSFLFYCVILIICGNFYLCQLLPLFKPDVFLFNRDPWHLRRVLKIPNFCLFEDHKGNVFCVAEVWGWQVMLFCYFSK